MQNININDKVSVTLTEHGMKIWRDYHYYFPELLTNSKEITTELWQLMNCFGNHLFNGCKQSFEENSIKLVK